MSYVINNVFIYISSPALLILLYYIAWIKVHMGRSGESLVLLASLSPSFENKLNIDTMGNII